MLTSNQRFVVLNQRFVVVVVGTDYFCIKFGKCILDDEADDNTDKDDDGECDLDFGDDIFCLWYSLCVFNLFNKFSIT